ncbi:MAG: cheW4 [Clostridia bacterium]|jgi:purine-binding chemotaxis protein CheW|nr:cheW4 [Clostridia bacterium]
MQVLTFFLGPERFAIDIKLVDTLENKMPITPVPKSKTYITGLISHRGDVIPVINTCLILSEDSIDNLLEKLIIINLESGKIALAVSGIDDVLDIEEENIETVNLNEDMSVVNIDTHIIPLLTYKQLKKI